MSRFSPGLLGHPGLAAAAGAAGLSPGGGGGGAGPAGNGGHLMKDYDGRHPSDKDSPSEHIHIVNFGEFSHQDPTYEEVGETIYGLGCNCRRPVEKRENISQSSVRKRNFISRAMRDVHFFKNCKTILAGGERMS